MSRGALFGFIAAEKTIYGVRRLCRVLGVSKTAFYDWSIRDGGPTSAELEEACAIHAAHQAWGEHRRVYGARRLTAEIRSRGHAWNRKRVARLMRVARIEGIHRRRRGKYGRRTASTATADDLVERNFTAPAPDQLWVADITYLRTWEGWLYLVAVQDVFSRRIVGWSMADHMRTELVLDALQMALEHRRPEPGLIHHSDQGSQYVSLAFGQTARAAGIAQSMGSRGDCFDNAVAESFFATLKKELVNRRPWPTKAELRSEIFDYIEVFYNRQRRHGTLGMRSPADFENSTLSPSRADLPASRLASTQTMRFTAPTTAAMT